MKKHQDNSFYIYIYRLRGLTGLVSAHPGILEMESGKGNIPGTGVKCPQVIPSLLHDFPSFYFSRTLKSV